MNRGSTRGRRRGAVLLAGLADDDVDELQEIDARPVRRAAFGRIEAGDVDDRDFRRRPAVRELFGIAETAGSSVEPLPDQIEGRPSLATDTASSGVAKAAERTRWSRAQVAAT